MKPFPLIIKKTTLQVVIFFGKVIVNYILDNYIITNELRRFIYMLFPKIHVLYFLRLFPFFKIIEGI
jgi:hypothetical protein